MIKLQFHQSGTVYYAIELPVFCGETLQLFIKHIKVKHIIILAAFFIVAATQQVSAQDSVDANRLSQILQSYYRVKDALVQGNSAGATAGASAFIKNLNGISYKLISEGNVNTLLKDAGAVAGAKDVESQRRYFANFSTNMAVLAKGLPLTGKPVYVQYCPMKNASWLSNEEAIKNPYYGSSMLTCGKVTDTLQ